MSDGKRIVIVGGVAGGASCAARARRLSEAARITMFERGENISFANCGMPYHIGGVIKERERLLVQTAEAMGQRHRIEVRTRCEVVAIDREARAVEVKDLETGQVFRQEYDALVLSPGADPVRPGLEGADQEGVYTLRNLEDMDRIKAAAEAAGAASALVVGGGYIGLEMAEALRERSLATTLVELADQVFVAADAEMVAPIHQQLSLHGVDLRLGTSVTGIRREGAKLRARLSTGEEAEADLIILAVGVRPEVGLARQAGLAIGALGGLAVDEQMRTSDEHIWAVGDAVEVTHVVSGEAALLPLAGPANRQGRIAADNIFGRASVYRGSQGTAICKVFDLAVGMTGLSEKQLQALGLSYEKVYVHPASHAGYYPGASPLSVKLLFEPATGKVLGAQAVGADGVDKRIDVLATALRAGMTVEDLAELELCYAPPYGSAKDAVNYAGFVASNVRAGDMGICHVEDVAAVKEGQVLLDVRTEAEVEAGTIPGAVHIPVDELRERLGKLSKEKEVLVFCQVGLRGYLAARTLSQHGYKVRNLTGGYKTYKAAMGMRPEEMSMTVEMREDAGEQGVCGACVGQPDSEEQEAAVAAEIDARGLQCPGPIMQLKEAIERVGEGEAVAVLAADGGFATDVQGWCHSTGHRLASLASEAGAYRAVVVKGGAKAAARVEPLSEGAGRGKRKSIVVFSGDFDKAMASFIIANGAAAMGSEVTMFFTFWGLNMLRRPERVAVRKTLVERMFAWMMPRGAGRLKLSQMHMGGMGTAMIKGVMRQKNVEPLEGLIASARQAGVRLVACTMSMELMGIQREELIDGVEEGGVAMYLDEAERGNVNLFI